MAHTVKFKLPAREVDFADVQFRVLKNGKAFGRLFISRGGVAWRPRSKVLKSRKLNWSMFDKLMQKHGRHARGT